MSTSHKGITCLAECLGIVRQVFRLAVEALSCQILSLVLENFLKQDS